MTTKTTCNAHRFEGYAYRYDSAKGGSELVCKGCGLPPAAHETIEETMQRLVAESFRAEWLASLKTGDHVLAGAGMLAELRGAVSEGAETAVVRWLNRDEKTGEFWGHHHSRVKVSTLAKVEGK